jgi:hypothetical protein
VAEQLQVLRGGFGWNRGQALLPGSVRLMDQGLQRLGGLDGPGRARVRLGRVSKITQ